MPEFIEPMAAQPVKVLPSGREWMYELKLDGFRTLIRKDGRSVTIRSRNDKDLAGIHPPLLTAATRMLADQVIVDGELVAIDSTGRPSFNALQHRSRHPKARIEFYAFDVLYLNGRDLRSAPLSKRRAHLASVVDESGLRISEEMHGSVATVLQAVRTLGLEGVVAKRRSSIYRSGERSDDWRKLRVDMQQEFVVGGFRPNGPDSVDALLVGFYEKRQLLYAAKVRGGLNTFNRRTLRLALQPLVIARCPFVNLPTKGRSRWGGGVTAEEMSAIQWVKPKLVAQIRFVEWTGEGRLRHAAFLGLRQDKSAKDVGRD